MKLPIITSEAELTHRLVRRRQTLDAMAPSVETILARVRNDGDAALRELTEQYDGIEVAELAVPPTVLAQAKKGLPQDVMAALSAAADNIRRFNEAVRPRSTSLTQPDGTEVARRWRPINRVGAYIPGGRYPLLSTVLMNVIPAQVAGVREIAVCTPPGPAGYPSATILGVCAFLGIEEVYQVGGAQAVGALAYGTETIRPVDKITGPGNAYVAQAKQLVSATVSIDMLAGPTEVVVLADGSANPRWVAGDLISQAEHDPLAWPVLITDSPDLAREVNRCLDELLVNLSTRATAEASLLGNGLVFLGSDWTACLAAVNTIAPEHLCLQTDQPDQWLDEVQAGAIFVGGSTPVAWGDYWAGPNHILPTAGQARFRGPLSVSDFLVPYSVIKATRAATSSSGLQVMILAEQEGLAGHALSIALRREDA